MYFERKDKKKTRNTNKTQTALSPENFDPGPRKLCSPPTNQRSTLFVFEKNHTAREPPVQPPDTLDDAERAQDREDESSPVHKGVSLVSEDTKEGPHNGDRCGQVTLNGGESVGCGSALEEEAMTRCAT